MAGPRARDYGYVRVELRRIGILTGALTAILVILGLVLR